MFSIVIYISISDFLSKVGNKYIINFFFYNEAITNTYIQFVFLDYIEYFNKIYSFKVVLYWEDRIGAIHLLNTFLLLPRFPKISRYRN